MNPVLGAKDTAGELGSDARVGVALRHDSVLELATLVVGEGEAEGTVKRAMCGYGLLQRHVSSSQKV